MKIEIEISDDPVSCKSGDKTCQWVSMKKTLAGSDKPFCLLPRVLGMLPEVIRVGPDWSLLKTKECLRLGKP